ncbi:hypothetical protein ACHAWU_000724 [Discostella pseudostelligera]|uniref:Uncharacterized protein n=1 Tax=Discostella pseudostelligera TaxID=259834 RepID=A0ABD3M5U3_9STRA
MGSSSSKPICIDCDKKTQQKDLPLDNSSSASKGMPCEAIYAKVTECMDKHLGQVAPCALEWDEFKECHANNNPRR